MLLTTAAVFGAGCTAGAVGVGVGQLEQRAVEALDGAVHAGHCTQLLLILQGRFLKPAHKEDIFITSDTISQGPIQSDKITRSDVFLFFYEGYKAL